MNVIAPECYRTTNDRSTHSGEALQRKVGVVHRPRYSRRPVCMGLMIKEYRVMTDMG